MMHTFAEDFNNEIELFLTIRKFYETLILEKRRKIRIGSLGKTPISENYNHKYPPELKLKIEAILIKKFNNEELSLFNSQKKINDKLRKMVIKHETTLKRRNKIHEKSCYVLEKTTKSGININRRKQELILNTDLFSSILDRFKTNSKSLLTDFKQNHYPNNYN